MGPIALGLSMIVKIAVVILIVGFWISIIAAVVAEIA